MNSDNTNSESEERLTNGMRLDIENTSLTSWPAISSERLGSWILRIGDGYSKRANSATYTAGTQTDINKQIVECERRFRLRGLPPVFRLPDFTQPDEVDDSLAQRDYAIVDPTLVLTCPIREFCDELDYQIEQMGKAQWFEHFGRFGALSAPRRNAHNELVGRMSGRRIFAGVVDNHDVVAVALGVVEGRFLGIFDVITNPTRRNEGFGTRLIKGVMQASKALGADWTYLQVVEGNEAALCVYESLGFDLAYRYWYRVAPILR